jgi:hypothetical protein
MPRGKQSAASRLERTLHECLTLSDETLDLESCAFNLVTTGSKDENAVRLWDHFHGTTTNACS